MRFLQQDVLFSALGDLALTADPLTSNRFALAGGNPVSFVEWDGHMPLRDGFGDSTQSTHSSVSNSTSSIPFQGPRRRISSVF